MCTRGRKAAAYFTKQSSFPFITSCSSLPRPVGRLVLRRLLFPDCPLRTSFLSLSLVLLFLIFFTNLQRVQLVSWLHAPSSSSFPFHIIPSSLSLAPLRISPCHFSILFLLLSHFIPSRNSRYPPPCSLHTWAVEKLSKKIICAFVQPRIRKPL